MSNLCEKLVNGAQNMLTKRGFSKLVRIEPNSQFGYAYLTDEKILLYIPPIVDGILDKIKNEQTHYLYFLIDKYKCTNAIVPYSTIAPISLDNIKSYEVFQIELFQFEKLLFDPTEHELVPLHTLLTKDEIATELKDIGCEKLPRILETDAIIKFYGWKKGGVVRINRKECIYYKVIV